MKNYFFTSESVTEGHPDKVADLISDNVANYLINQNESHRAAIETMVSSNMVTIAGEVKTDLMDNKETIEELVRQTVKDIGYEQENFHWNSLSFKNLIHNQSVDIARGTDNFGAGDQGMMFGYACNENDSLMPSAIFYSHKITKALSTARHSGQDWLGPDGKAQVTVEYSNVNEPVRISNVICSTQHSKDLKDNPDLKKGLIYENQFNNKPQFFRGETGAQSSMIPYLDGALGIYHTNDHLRHYLNEMRDYMPPEHRKLIEDVETKSNAKHFIHQSKKLISEYNKCLEEIRIFRAQHLEFAATYIHKQAQTSNSFGTGGSTIRGTGGTPFMKYLKKHRDETNSQKV